MSHIKPTVSAVIPAFNEAGRIWPVLRVATKSKLLKEVIVVDDGSTDNTEDLLAEKSINIKYIKHKKNKGKSAAVLTGINEAKGDIIMLLDADLKNFQQKHIKKLLDPVVNGDYAMTILDRVGDRTAILGWTNIPRLFGGERVFYKKHFLKVGIKSTDQFLIEPKLNLYHIKNNLKVKTIYCDDLFSPQRYEKFGFFVGLKKYIKMYAKYIAYANPWGFYQMMVKIEEDRMEKLYKLNYIVKILGPIILIRGMYKAAKTQVKLKLKQYIN